MYKFILFDLDGTLTDPAEGILTSVRYALQKEGLDPRPNEDLTWVIGPPLKESMATLAGTADEQTVRRLLLAYRERFGSTGLYENRVLTGIPELLDTLVHMGCNLYVATSKPTVYARQILHHFRLNEFFSGIVGSELDESRSEKEEVIRYLLSTFALPKEQCIMVGDRRHDVIGARENGIRTIGVLYGYGTQSELTDAGALDLAESVSQLRSILTRDNEF